MELRIIIKNITIKPAYILKRTLIEFETNKQRFVEKGENYSKWQEAVIEYLKIRYEKRFLGIVWYNNVRAHKSFTIEIK